MDEGENIQPIRIYQHIFIKFSRSYSTWVQHIFDIEVDIVSFYNKKGLNTHSFFSREESEDKKNIIFLRMLL